MDDQDQQDSVVIEAEVVETEIVAEADTATGESTNQATVMLSLEGLIKNNLGGLDKLQNDLKKQQEMIANVLASDQTYTQHDERVKEAQKLKNTTKSEIMKRPDVAQVVNKVKEMREEVKEQRQTLSDLLLEYQRVSGNTEIETEDGQLLEIVNSSKLVRRS